nr:immunoglobulin heavy chain junction region [Macaca mulatta]MOX93780.1 immunoglobulin heavy chain junction region [Macaca mulatta]MOX95748.1 immunoglobulin heavy chain junction region [Macaca mulatta]MOX96104.1 immunoglobulin heavy chain junction region [Macaca mulatta]MOX97076.1 immunoglobulin heavy chain junction region [Macaca mulatta]
CSNGITSLDVW